MLSPVSGQSISTPELSASSSVYPGAIYITPQDSSFLAPRIYRSVSTTPALTSPMEVIQICARDFRETKSLQGLYANVSEAAGVTDIVNKDIGAKLTGIDLKYVNLSAELEFKNEATITATPLRVVSADDDISSIVLASIRSDCKKIVREHLRQGRAVFVAAKAIQAKDFTIELNVGPKGSVEASCRFIFFCSSGPSARLEARNQRQFKRSAIAPVTFALVPAEVSSGRTLVGEADLRDETARRRVAKRQLQRDAGIGQER